MIYKINFKKKNVFILMVVFFMLGKEFEKKGE